MADGISEKTATLETVERAVRKFGLPEPDKPEPTDEGEVPIWPANVADLTHLELAHHLTWWSGWIAYATNHLGRAKTNLSGFDEQLNHEKSKFLFGAGIGIKGDYSTVTEAKAAFDGSTPTAKMKKSVLEAKALVTALESLLKGYEEKRFTISRELTRRGIEGGAEGRRNDRFST